MTLIPFPSRRIDSVMISPAVKRRSIHIVRKEFSDILQTMHRKDQPPPCFGRGKYFTEFSKEDAPSPEQARMMCGNCPALAIHDELARMEKPDLEVAGGNVWVDKKLVRPENEEAEAA